MCVCVCIPSLVLVVYLDNSLYKEVRIMASLPDKLRLLFWEFTSDSGHDYGARNCCPRLWECNILTQLVNVPKKSVQCVQS